MANRSNYPSSRNISGAYNDLQYANTTPVVQQRPVKELTDLYKSKADAYNYVATASNQLDRSIANTPHIERDKSHLYETSQEIQGVLNEYEEAGDLENRVLDVNKLVSDASKKLIPIQQRKAQRDAKVQELMAKDKDGNLIHSMEDIKKGIYLLDKRTEDLTYDEQLGTYVGGIGSVNVPAKQDYTAYIDKMLKDWESSKELLYDRYGNRLVDIGNGKLQAGERIYNDRNELMRSARSALLNNPDFKDKMQFDLEYELDVLLSEEDGSRRDMTMEDIEGRVSGDLGNIVDELNLTGDKSLKDQLQDQDVTPEQFYRQMRTEQVTNSIIQLGVNKQDYEQFSDKILNNDMLLKALSWQDKNRSGGMKPIDNEAFVSIAAIQSDNIANPTDYNNIKTGYEGSKDTLQTNMGKLNLAIQEGVTGDDLVELKRRVREDNDNIENFERQLNNIRDHVKTTSGFDFTDNYEAYIFEAKEDRQRARVFNEGRKTEEEIIAKFPILPREQYENAVIDDFINQNYENIAEALITGDDEARIDKAAENLKKAYGGDVETRPFTLDRHRFIIQNSDSKDSKAYLNFEKAKKEAFRLSPDTFVNGTDNFSTIMDEKGITVDEIDTDKSEVIPLIESVRKQPGYMIIARDHEGNELGRSTFNHDGELAGDSEVMKDLAIREAYNRFGDKDLTNLDVMDAGMFSKLSLLYVDNHPIGNAIDDGNLYASNAGDRIPITMPTGESNELLFTVGVQKDYLSPSSQEGKDKTYIDPVVFSITNPEGKTFINTTDSEGNTKTEWDYYKEGDAGKTPVTFRSPSEIKELYGKGMMEQQIVAKQARYNTNPYLDWQNITTDGEQMSITPIFGDNIKNDVSPYVHKEIYNNVQKLGADYNGLYITDSYRDRDSKTGAQFSQHKKGKALDARKDGISMRLFKTDKAILRSKYGIVSIEPHRGGTMANSIQEADHFHIVFE